MVFFLKCLISIGIVSITTYLGFSKSKNLSSREYILKDMVTFFNLVENEIKYMLTILPNAYEIARQKLITNLKNVIGNIVVDMLKNNSSFENEKSVMENVSTLSELTDYDKSVFISTLNNLGNSNLESQLNIIENTKQILNDQIKEAIIKKQESARVYKSIGVISGVMIVLVFI
mgnify:CR=1 FL=1